MESPQKKRLSKGCLIAIIIAAALVVLLLIAIFAFWSYRHDLAKWTVIASVNEIKTAVAENPPEGYDTAYFNSVTDRFLKYMDTQDTLNLAGYGELVKLLQEAKKQTPPDAPMLDRIVGALGRFYPELDIQEPGSEVPDQPVHDTPAEVPDTLGP